jgi:hypothetical protein
MLLWIAAAGAALGMYSLSFAPFTAIENEPPEAGEADDD